MIYYYSVFYRTIPRTFSPEFAKENYENYETGLLFARSKKLNNEEIIDVIKSHLAENKIIYNELIITESKEISQQEYIDRTQYS